jgi:hypothetical protein
VKKQYKLKKRPRTREKERQTKREKDEKPDGYNKDATEKTF